MSFNARMYADRHSCRYCGVYFKHVDTHSEKLADHYCCAKHQRKDDAVICSYVPGHDIEVEDVDE
jgi:hypothetical protein